MMHAPNQVGIPEHLCHLKEGWDGYRASPPTAAALACASLMACVPTSDGGLQLEMHSADYDIEITISAAGRVVGVHVETPIN